MNVHLAGGLELGIYWVPIPAMIGRRERLAAVFGQWRLITVLRVTEALRSEVERLQEEEGKRAESIWHMTKEQLIEVARQELGMKREIASKETVVTLREKIRSHRKSQNTDGDPLLTLPKGLSKLSSEQLAYECHLRGLDPSTTDRPGHQWKTRPQMITMIRDLVDRNNSSSAAGSQEGRQKRNATSSKTGEDWAMCDDL